LTQKTLKYFSPKKIVTKLSEKQVYELDLGSGKKHVQDPRGEKASDPDPQHCLIASHANVIVEKNTLKGTIA
jgi:hypothetical protein